MTPDDIIAYPAAAAGTQTRVLEAGHGPVVVFLHGVGARADRWRRNLAAVADAGFRCLALDLPGHGFAAKGAGFSYGVPGYADFVEAFLKEHGIGQAHFVGTALGAHVLGTVAHRSPSLAASLTVIGATGMFPIGKEARERIAGRMLDRSVEGTRRKLATVMLDPANMTESLVQEEWRINNSPGSTEGFTALAQYFREHLDEDVVGDRLAAMPAGGRRLILWGEEDRSVPLSIGRNVEKLLQAPLTAIRNTAHAPYWESPTVFNRLLVEFLARA
jgi:pimeloyl-ACP methyl ester carboxylesterase